MKDSVRKQALEQLEILPQDNPEALRLREEYKRKGFLSKRELKVLQSLVNDAAASHKVPLYHRSA